MPSIMLDCPHCTANSMGFALVYETPIRDKPSNFLTLGICGKCAAGVVVEYMSVQRVSWSRLSEQIFRIDKWSVCRG
jgi:hypothetical protein